MKIRDDVFGKRHHEVQLELRFQRIRVENIFSFETDQHRAFGGADDPGAVAAAENGNFAEQVARLELLLFTSTQEGTQLPGKDDKECMAGMFEGKQNLAFRIFFYRTEAG